MNMQSIETASIPSDSLPFYTEDKIITPLAQILESYPQQGFIRPSLTDIFPEQEYEDKEVKKVRQILGEADKDTTTEEIKTFATEVQYLCDTLLDQFERDIFDGMTLRELLNEG